MELGELLQKAQGHLHVERAFGAPIERDGCTVVPVAMVAGGGGGGGGGENDPSGGGMGAGWGGVSYPLGAYVVKGGDVRFVPALDITRLAIGVLALFKLGLKLRFTRKAAALKLSGSGG
jgi:uncharacterized spore protein YtfJ